MEKTDGKTPLLLKCYFETLLRSDVLQMKGADWSRVTKAFSSFSCEATAGFNFAVDFHIKQKEK